MTKSDLYTAMAEKLAPLWERDIVLLDVETTTGRRDLWTYARTIDDWLVTYRDDDRVGVEQYAKNCDRLLNLYRVTAWELLQKHQEEQHVAV